MDVTLRLVLTAPRSKEWLMTYIAVRCPPCPREQLVQRGNTGCGPRWYLCQNPPCATGGLLRDSRYRGRLPAVQQQRIAMRLNASGVRDTARGLRSRPATGCRARRKTAAGLESVPPTCLRPPPDDIAMASARAGDAEAERDERGAFGGHPGNPRWLWHALEHPTGQGCADVLGRRTDAVLLRRQARLEPCGLTRF